MGFLSGLFSKADDGAKDAVQTKAQILCPVAGEAIELSSVNDPAFASKAMGDGLAIKPNDNTLVAPLSGTVVALFPTGHALGIKGENGITVLIHIGIDTVEMNGEGFETLVAQGDHVEVGQQLVRFDRARIAEAGYEDTTMVLVSEATCNGTMNIRTPGSVALGDQVIWYA